MRGIRRRIPQYRRWSDTTERQYPNQANTALIKTVTDEDGNVTEYGYELPGQGFLSSAVRRDAGGQLVDERSYAYDAMGNRSSKTTNGVTRSFTYDAANQLTVGSYGGLKGAVIGGLAGAAFGCVAGVARKL